jgi:hypothetical protein
MDEYGEDSGSITCTVVSTSRQRRTSCRVAVAIHPTQRVQLIKALLDYGDELRLHMRARMHGNDILPGT